MPGETAEAVSILMTLIADSLKEAGFLVHYVNMDPVKQEVQLAACVYPSGKWKLSDIRDFAKAFPPAAPPPLSPPLWLESAPP